MSENIHIPVPAPLRCAICRRLLIVTRQGIFRHATPGEQKAKAMALKITTGKRPEGDA